MLKQSFVQQRISKSAAAAAPAAADPAEGEELFELTNITVKEVSLVDRPANQREFLIRKRDDRKGRGWGKPPSSRTEKGVDPAADLDAADAEKARIALEAEDKAQSERERALLAGTATEKSDPPEAEKKPSVDPPAKEPDKPVDGDDKTEERPNPAASGDVDADDDDTADAAPSEGVKKVGRKMSKTRRAKLKAIVAAAQELLSEVADEPDEPAEKAAAEDPPEVAPSNPAAPPAGTPAEPAEPAAPGQPAAIPPAPIPAPVTEPPASVPAKETDPEVERLKAVVGTLQKMVAAQGALLAKSGITADSNAIDLEKSQLDHDKVSWPVDLADRRERIKGRSF
jgi:hypothetical protein